MIKHRVTIYADGEIKVSSKLSEHKKDLFVFSGNKEVRVLQDQGVTYVKQDRIIAVQWQEYER